MSTDHSTNPYGVALPPMQPQPLPLPPVYAQPTPVPADMHMPAGVEYVTHAQLDASTYAPPQQVPAAAPVWNAEHVAAEPVTMAPVFTQPARDPSRTALAAVITFIVALIGLWAILSYMNSMAKTLSSIDSGNQKMIGQLKVANSGLRELDRKTSYVGAMNDDAAQLRELMGGLDSSMGEMIGGVDRIGTEMGSMSGSLKNLDESVTKVGATNTAISTKLGTINSGLATEASKVRGMRLDVDASAKALNQLPPALRTTNARLAYINSVVCLMGKVGIANALKIKVTFFGIPNGSAELSGVIIPPGGWAC